MEINKVNSIPAKSNNDKAHTKIDGVSQICRQISDVKTMLLVALEPLHNDEKGEVDEQRVNAGVIRDRENIALTYAADIFPCLSDCFCAEDNPADNNESKGKKHLQGFTPSREKATFGDLVGVFAVCAKKDKWKE